MSCLFFFFSPSQTHSNKRVELDFSGTWSGAAAIKFRNGAGASAALAAASINLVRFGSNVVRGPARWASEVQRRPNPDQLMREATAFMAEFDARQEELRRENQNEVVDEDGFTLVTKARGKRGVSDGETHVKAAKTRAKRAHVQTEEAFYGLHKIRARQRAVKELREKFFAEKERLKKQKQARKQL